MINKKQNYGKRYMDNEKTDGYYVNKIQKDLTFIEEHMKTVDIEELLK